MSSAKRRSGRIAKEIAIILMGTDTAGRVFSEETRTVVLSRHGAGILSKYRLAPDEILTMRFRGGSTEAAVRLVGEMGKDARGFTYGVAFVDEELDFWELKFPPPPQYLGGGTLELECGLCRARSVVDQTEVEADVFALAGYILRFCAKCGTSTEWKNASVAAHPTPAVEEKQSAKRRVEEEASERALEREIVAEKDDEVTASAGSGFYSSASPELVTTGSSKSPVMPGKIATVESATSEPLPPVATSVVARTANRRRDVRTRVSFTACIRRGVSDEIVECDNVSKGGLSFRSRNAYAVGSSIDVAVPYSPGAPAIFVSATIRHVQTIAAGSLFRYGAKYARKGIGESQVQRGY
jgi:hypothetical protein